MFVEGLVTDTQGNPIPNATIDTWQTDGDGLYDVQVREKIKLGWVCMNFIQKKTV